jgi:hypothetical protein
MERHDILGVSFDETELRIMFRYDIFGIRFFCGRNFQWNKIFGISKLKAYYSLAKLEMETILQKHHSIIICVIIVY